MNRFFSSSVAVVVALSACSDSKPPAPQAVDAGSAARVLSVASKDDATRVVSRFLAALQSGDRAAIAETVAAPRLVEAVDRSATQPLGPERHTAFRDALAAELVREDWRALYQGASVNRVALGNARLNTVVVITLDGGAERRAEVASETGQPPLIVRVH